MALKKEADSYEEVNRIIKEYEVTTCSRFIVEHHDKIFFQERNIKDTTRLYWNLPAGENGLKIACNGTPFAFLGRRVLMCHQGKDRNLGQKKKHKEKRERLLKEDGLALNSRFLTRPTKKMDCPLSIHVKRVAYFTEFKISQHRPTEHMKKKMVKQIREKLKVQTGDCKISEKYLILLPDPKKHENHMVELPDPRIRKKTKDLVSSGIYRNDPLLDSDEEFFGLEEEDNINQNIKQEINQNASQDTDHDYIVGTIVQDVQDNPERKTQIKKLQMSARSMLKQMFTLTYSMDDGDTLATFHKDLSSIYKNALKSATQQDGTVMEHSSPQIKKRPKKRPQISRRNNGVAELKRRGLKSKLKNEVSEAVKVIEYANIYREQEVQREDVTMNCEQVQETVEVYST